jgi:peptidoglycan L-alanyl-D-glutamate endopeptidase CwlK
MPVLKSGSSGDAVTKLQTKLKQLGFKPGKIDGKFGSRTKNAVLAFQAANKLKADGMVGPKTLAALEKAQPPSVSGLLQLGAKGPAVTDVQKRLILWGFNPGRADGKFGPKTEAAVLDFQKSRKLKADGIVGPKTLAALNEKPKLDITKKKIKVTPELVAKMFPGVPLINIQQNLPFVLKALKEAKLADRDMVLMALATIRAETGNFTPLSEFRSKYNTSPGGHPFDKYDNRTDLGNRGRPDGDLFKGRGYIQLTGRTNYEVHGAAIGLGNQLVEDPTLANQPEIAAKLLASFLKSHENRIRQALALGNLRAARKLVNGGSHGLTVFTDTFRTGESVFA